jgi:hypothetical protein
MRAYAKNDQGAGYSNESEFSSLSEKIFRDVKLSTQDEVVKFGADNDTTIEGSLNILGSVTDLSPLKRLAIINYALYVRNTTSLLSLSGLDGLESSNNAGFFHGMWFENNKALSSFKGLEKIRYNDGHLYFINNDAPTDLNGFDGLRSSHFGELRIENCDNLKSLNGFQNLEWLDGNLMLKDNLALNDLKGLHKLNFISKWLFCINNQSFENPDGLEQLHKAEGIELHHNPSLREINGISQLDTVTLVLYILSNPRLKALSAFHKLTTVEYLSIQSNDALTNLSGFERLKSLGNRLHIRRNKRFKSLKGVENLETMPYLVIIENPALVNLKGIDCFNRKSSMRKLRTWGFKKVHHSCRQLP